jgi:hypothetical protein
MRDELRQNPIFAEGEALNRLSLGEAMREAVDGCPILRLAHLAKGRVMCRLGAQQR